MRKRLLSTKPMVNAPAGGALAKVREIWFKDKTKGREKVKQDIALAHNAFERLSGILTKKLRKSSTPDYDKASWPYFQADSNGYNRALEEVLKLIEETD